MLSLVVSLSVAQAACRLLSLLIQSLEFWDAKHVPPHPVLSYFFVYVPTLDVS